MLTFISFISDIIIIGLFTAFCVLVYKKFKKKGVKKK